MIDVAIIGATGYTAYETINILLRHPHARITYLTALPDECAPLAHVFPALHHRLDLPIEPLNLDTLTDKADLALCCLPHKISMQFVPQLLQAGLKVVDFSADYRIRNVKLYEQVYNVPHTDPDNVPHAVFGLPELFRDRIPPARLVANPGCYPTAAALALAPLLREQWIAPDDIVVNAVSGASGAGRKAALKFHFPEMNENLFAYAIGTHRHQPEIDQILTDASPSPVTTLFVPHVVSIDRGIAESIYARPNRNVTTEQLDELYRTFYADETFVRILNQPPQLKHIASTNFVDIFPTVVGNKIAVFATIDNLVKGAAGQAVQNMNLICDLPETTALL